MVAALRDRYLSSWDEEIERLLAEPDPGEEVARLEQFLRSMYEFHADKVELHHLLLASEGAEDEIIEKSRKRLLEFVRTGVKRKVFTTPKLDATVDFIMSGLHGPLVSYLHYAAALEALHGGCDDSRSASARRVKRR